MIRGFHVTEMRGKKVAPVKGNIHLSTRQLCAAKHPIPKAKRKYEDKSKTQQEPIRQDVTSIAFLVVHFQ